MTGSSGNELPENEIQKTDLCTNEHKYRSIPRFGKSLN